MWAGLAGAQAGDAVGGFALACAGGAAGSVAGDLEDLRGAGEIEVFGGGQDLDEALFKAADAGAGVMRGVRPGHGVQAVVVAFAGQDVVRFGAGQVAGVSTGAVRRDPPGQTASVQQGLEPDDLTGSPLHLPLRHHRSVMVGEGDRQVHPRSPRVRAKAPHTDMPSTTIADRNQAARAA